MAEQQWHYRAYLLRLWWTSSGGRLEVRASLEDPHTGERLGFSSLNHFVAFLRAAIDGEEVVRDDPQRGADQM